MYVQMHNHTKSYTNIELLFCINVLCVGSSLPIDQLANILTTLLEGLQGRTWDGKVHIISGGCFV